MADPYGYEGDHFKYGENAAVHFPSLPEDGDPFFHSPVPVPERHGDFNVFNPSKEPVDLSVVDETIARHDAETLTSNEADVIRRMEQEFGD